MKFQRLDTGEIIETRTPSVIVFGEATIEIDGKKVLCRKVAGSEATGLPPSLTSDTLGVPCHSVEKYRADAAAHGFSGVEFKQDPIEPTFFQAHFSGPDERVRYEKHCGLRNQSGTNGGRQALSPRDIEQARELAIRQYGSPVLAE